MTELLSDKLEPTRRKSDSRLPISRIPIQSNSTSPVKPSYAHLPKTDKETQVGVASHPRSLSPVKPKTVEKRRTSVKPTRQSATRVGQPKKPPGFPFKPLIPTTKAVAAKVSEEPVGRAVVVSSPVAASHSLKALRSNSSSNSQTQSPKPTLRTMSSSILLGQAEEGPPTSDPSQTTIPRGMERGYVLSPMYTLYLEYSKEEESEHSVSRRVALLATAPDLELEDVEEWRMDDGGLYYQIKNSVLARIKRTMTELQVFIERMAALIVERENKQYFVVDPGDMIIKTLSKPRNLHQLQAGWVMLVQRMAASQKFTAKYIIQYKDETLPSSPVSTAAELHEALEAEPSTDNKLKLAFATILRHASKLSENDKLMLRKYGAWEDTKVVPRWLDSIEEEGHTPLEGECGQASPNVESREPRPDAGEEESPATGDDQRASQGGEEQSVSSGGQTRASEEAEEIYTAGAKGKGKEVSWKDNEWNVYEGRPLMGGGTPFKSSKGFFGRQDSAGGTPYPQRGRGNSYSTISNPNVLHGLAAPSSSRAAEPWSSVSGYLSNHRSEAEANQGGERSWGKERNRTYSRSNSSSSSNPQFPLSLYQNPEFQPSRVNQDWRRQGTDRSSTEDRPGDKEDRYNSSAGSGRARSHHKEVHREVPRQGCSSGPPSGDPDDSGSDEGFPHRDSGRGPPRGNPPPPPPS